MRDPRTSQIHPSSSDGGLEDLLAELLVLPPESRSEAIASMRVRHPARAETLQRRLDLLAAELDDDDENDDEPREERLGRFEILSRLGGGLTDVYLVRDPERSDPVVLKVLRLPSIQSSALRQSLAREATAAARIDHPCIGRVLETGEIEDTPYLLCPHIAGMTLADWIRRQQERRRRVGTEELRLIATWLQDIASALAAAHASGLVHRDVKPSNILIPLQGRAQIIDFGMCQRIDGDRTDRESTPLAGTLAYMSPELLSQHERPIGPAADIYALGITLFECTALRLPFAADTRGQLSRLILRNHLPDVCRHGARLPRGLRRIIAGATAKFADDRYPSMDALANDLDRLLRGERVRGAGPSAIRRFGRWLADHRLLASTAAAMLAALGLVLAVLLDLWFARREALAALQLLEVPGRVQQAVERADRLVPGWPEQIDALEAWLRDDGEPLRAMLPALRQGLASERARPQPDPAVVTTLARGLGALEPFATHERGTLATVRARLRWARVVAQKTIDGHTAEWAATRAQIAADPRYGGLDLAPQLDLVPLGRDPSSGLFEFYHPRSGAEGAAPVVRDAGILRRSDQAGLVFVLVPGGTFVMGHQHVDPSQPRYDADAGDYASPQTVELAAFFVSKYEMTQGQWWHLTGELPSQAAVGRNCAEGLITYLHPVECVTALECDRVLASVGLALPTEAQWEYAAGTGATSRWSFGDDPSQMWLYANVGDRRHCDPEAPHFDFDDGTARTAPVGQKHPNAFGLYDCIGNVQEWCRDSFESYAKAPARPGDGFRAKAPDPRDHRILRGGSFMSIRYVGTSYRRDDLPDRREETIGLRPARPVLLEKQ